MNEQRSFEQDHDPQWREAPPDETTEDREPRTALKGPRVAEWPPRDLHKFNWITFFKVAPWAIACFQTKVPDEFWTIDPEAPEVASVACPCGHEPQVRVAKVSECECGRFFLGMGDEIRVFRPDDDPAES